MNVEYREMEVPAMVTAGDRGKRNDAQNRLAKMREKYVTSNPMSMDEIDQIIHGE